MSKQNGNKKSENKLWQKHMRPWTPGSGNLAMDMPEERKRKLAEKINRIIKAYEKNKEKG